MDVTSEVFNSKELLSTSKFISVPWELMKMIAMASLLQEQGRFCGSKMLYRQEIAALKSGV